MDEHRNFLQPAIPAKWPGLVAGAAKFESNEIVIEMDDLLDVFDFAAKVAGTKNVTGRRDSRGGRIQRRQGCLRRLGRGNRDNEQKHEADHNESACGVLE